MIAPKELEKKANISIGLFVGCVVAAFSLGGTVATLMSQVGQIEDIKEDIKKSKQEAFDYTTQEVGGLRSDWDRDRIEKNKDIDELQKHHVKE